MRRSRSPPSRDRNVNCVICHDPTDVTIKSIWQCTKCTCRCHSRCMNLSCHEVWLWSQGLRGATNYRCPSCRSDHETIVRWLTTPARATKGMICFWCRLPIRPGTLFRQCASPSAICCALYHDTLECRPPRNCYACRTTLAHAMEVRALLRELDS